jgi:hypothetical protein
VDGPREGPLVLLFLIATIAASVYVLRSAEADAVKDPKQKAARGEITSLSKLSLVRPENLRQALAKVDAGKYPLIMNVRVAPDRVNVFVRDKDGYRKYLQIDPGFGVQTNDANVGEDYAVHSESVNVGGPLRMLEAVLAKTALPPAAFDYASLSFSENSKPTWYMAMKTGPARVRQWIAEADGSDIRRPGELSSADKKRQADTKRENDRIQREARRRVRHVQAVIKRRNRCFQRAGDAAAAAKCIERFPL